MFSLTTSLILNSLFGYQTATHVISTNPHQQRLQVHKESQQLTLMHGITLESAVNLNEYYVSEKLDGVRAYWDGRHLWSRSGLLIKAPASLINELPAIPLDGELWLGRGNFNRISGLIHRNDPSHSYWDQVSFAVFDLPSHTGAFKDRYSALQSLFPVPPEPSQEYPVFTIPQHTLTSEQTLLRYLREVTDKGGEGLMLHKTSNIYTYSRSANVLKLKPTNFTQATVIGYKPGTGKYEGKVGSLHVTDENGLTFYVGSGLTDELRNRPPAIGSSICIKHSGFTANNKPRFPRYSKLCT